MLNVVTINVNGVRAALRKGGLAWLLDAWNNGRADIICLQEVRATTDQLHEALTEAGFADVHVLHDSSAKLGHAGAAIVSRFPFTSTTLGLGRFTEHGRWAEARVHTPVGELDVVSVYVHAGDSEREERQAEKYAFLDAMDARMAAARADGIETIILGDLNVAHRQVDLANWKGNLKSAGFLPAERAYFDAWFDTHGWVDLGRAHGGEGPGPYTWWSMRGKAFDNNVGWRIDYALATPGVAARCTGADIWRAPSWGERWSDHSPVTFAFA